MRRLKTSFLRESTHWFPVVFETKLSSPAEPKANARLFSQSNVGSRRSHAQNRFSTIYPAPSFPSTRPLSPCRLLWPNLGARDPTSATRGSPRQHTRIPHSSSDRSYHSDLPLPTCRQSYHLSSQPLAILPLGAPPPHLRLRVHASSSSSSPLQAAPMEPDNHHASFIHHYSRASQDTFSHALLYELGSSAIPLSRRAEL